MTADRKLIVSCPTCKKSVAWNDKFPAKPFCSERCKLIDLGEWADEKKRIPGEPAATHLESDFEQE